MMCCLTKFGAGFHLESAKKNGITKDEIVEIITHSAFYAGWPKAWAAFRMAKEVWCEETSNEWLEEVSEVDYTKVTKERTL